MRGGPPPGRFERSPRRATARALVRSAVRVSMHDFYEQFLDRLSLVHEEIGKTIEGLPLEAIDWIPGPEMNSLGILMAHVAGSGKNWFGGVIAGDATGRDRG